MAIAAVIFLLFGFSEGTNFEILHCNKNNKEPELKLRISKEYFEENLTRHKSKFFELPDGYIKIVADEDLVLKFDNDDYLSLNFYLETDSDQAKQHELHSFSFENTDTLRFSCRYPRLVSVGTTTSLADDLGPTDIIAEGKIEYEATVENAFLEQYTRLNIKPLHKISAIHANVVECEISYQDRSIYPLHSFGATLCREPRLDVSIPKTHPEIEIDYRTFRFNHVALAEQHQYIRCTLRLDNELEELETNIPDCTCPNEEECECAINGCTMTEWAGQCTVDYDPDESERVLNGLNDPDGYQSDTMTVEYCITYCRDQNFAFAGLQWRTQCFCGNKAPTELAPENDCNIICAGDSAQTCGGYLRNSVYATDYKTEESDRAAVVQTSTPGTSPTTTTTSTTSTTTKRTTTTTSTTTTTTTTTTAKTTTSTTTTTTTPTTTTPPATTTTNIAIEEVTTSTSTTSTTTTTTLLQTTSLAHIEESENQFKTISDRINTGLKTCKISESRYRRHTGEMHADRDSGGLVAARIVNGTPVYDDSWKWMVRIHFQTNAQYYADDSSDPENSSMCGGVIIDKKWILTAAHCCINHDVANIIVNDKIVAENEDGEFKTTSKKFFIHEDYSTKSPNKDICLIKSKNDLSKHVQSTPCRAENFDIAEHHGAACWVAGWGLKSYGGPFPNILQSAGINLMSKDYCMKHSFFAEKGHVIQSDEVCGGLQPTEYSRKNENGNLVTSQGKDACQGDSGGPLICDLEGVATVVGVVSWGVGCNREGLPGVYSNVHYYKNWIDQKIEAYGN